MPRETQQLATSKIVKFLDLCDIFPFYGIMMLEIFTYVTLMRGLRRIMQFKPIIIWRYTDFASAAPLQLSLMSHISSFLTLHRA